MRDGFVFVYHDCQGRDSYFGLRPSKSICGHHRPSPHLTQAMQDRLYGCALTTHYAAFQCTEYFDAFGLVVEKINSAGSEGLASFLKVKKQAKG